MDSEPEVHAYRYGVEIGKEGERAGDDEEQPVATGSSGLPPRGSGASEEDPRYKDVRTIATGGYASGYHHD